MAEMIAVMCKRCGNIHGCIDCCSACDDVGVVMDVLVVLVCTI
jgi:hypothetical protein